MRSPVSFCVDNSTDVAQDSVLVEEDRIMARPPRQYKGSLSPGQAQYVLERLITERRVSASDIEGYVAQMGREISDLEQRLAAAGGRLAE